LLGFVAATSMRVPSVREARQAKERVEEPAARLRLVAEVATSAPRDPFDIADNGAIVGNDTRGRQVTVRRHGRPERGRLFRWRRAGAWR